MMGISRSLVPWVTLHLSLNIDIAHQARPTPPGPVISGAMLFFCSCDEILLREAGGDL